MSFINCTPHPIVVRKSDGTEITFAPSGIIPRMASETYGIGSFEGIELRRTKFGEVEGLPSWDKEGTLLIVSGMILDAVKRGDLVAPDTGPSAIRDSSGRIIAVTGFRKADAGGIWG